MNLIDEDLKLKIIAGKPILLQKSNCFFQHRTIEELIDFGLTEFLKIVNLFTLSDEEIQENFQFPIDNFFYLLLNLNNNTQLSSLIEKGFYFFIGATNLQANLENKTLSFSYKDLNNIEINKESFDELINYIQIVYNGNNEKEEDDSNLSEAERRMKEKFKKKKREREKAKARNGEVTTYFSDLIGGFWSKNYNMSWNEILQLPYYTFYFLLDKLKNTDNYEFQLRAMLAGADMKDKPLHHWLEGHKDDDTD